MESYQSLSGTSAKLNCNNTTTTNTNSSPRMPLSRSLTQPQGTIEYLVSLLLVRYHKCHISQTLSHCFSLLYVLSSHSIQVRERDTLPSVAAKFQTTPSELSRINKIIGRVIFPGQVFPYLSFPINYSENLTYFWLLFLHTVTLCAKK